MQCENLPIFLNISIFLRLRSDDTTLLLDYIAGVVFRSKFFKSHFKEEEEEKVSHSANVLIIFFYIAMASVHIKILYFCQNQLDFINSDSRHI